MRDRVRDIGALVGTMDPRMAKLILVILSVVMFVLGAGAPGDGGGWGGG